MGVAAHMRRAIDYGATKEDCFEAIKAPPSLAVAWPAVGEGSAQSLALCPPAGRWWGRLAFSAGCAGGRQVRPREGPVLFEFLGPDPHCRPRHRQDGGALIASNNSSFVAP